MSDFVRSLFGLDGKQVVVSGAGGYFGQYISEAFLEAGARVVLLGRSSALADRAQAYRARFGADRVQVYLADFYERDELENTGRRLATEQCADVLVNNAFDFSIQTGFNTLDGRLESCDASHWQHAFESGLYWAVRLTQFVGEGMRKRGRGSIINVSSMYGLVTPFPALYEATTVFNPPTYGPMKAALLAFTRYVAAFWGPDGIRCNALVPGSFPNTAFSSPNAVDQDPDFLGRLAAQTLLGRVGHPRDLIGALLLLASDAGAYITGQAVVVDGGWTAR